MKDLPNLSLKKILTLPHIKPLLIAIAITILATATFVYASTLFVKEIPSHGEIVSPTSLTFYTDDALTTPLSGNLEFGDIIQGGESFRTVYVHNDTGNDLTFEFSYTDDPLFPLEANGATLSCDTLVIPAHVTPADYTAITFHLDASGATSTGEFFLTIHLATVYEP